MAGGRSCMAGGGRPAGRARVLSRTVVGHHLPEVALLALLDVRVDRAEQLDESGLRKSGLSCGNTDRRTLGLALGLPSSLLRGLRRSGLRPGLLLLGLWR